MVRAVPVGEDGAMTLMNPSQIWMQAAGMEVEVQLEEGVQVHEMYDG